MKRILLIDDNSEIFSVVQDALKRPAYQLDFCGDPFAVLATLEQKNYDLMICDIKMPGVSGLVLVEELRKQGIQTPVLFITGANSDEIAAEVIRLRATGLVEKPFRLTDLRARVAKILE